MARGALAFKTSGQTPRVAIAPLALGVCLVVLRTRGVLVESEGPRLPAALAALLLWAALCLHGRFELTIDLDSGAIRRMRGFWPFAAAHEERASDNGSLLITAATGRGATDSLWLVRRDGGRVCLASSSAWTPLSDRANEQSEAIGWPLWHRRVTALIDQTETPQKAKGPWERGALGLLGIDDRGGVGRAFRVCLT